jgi:hypothetical protein
MASILLGVYAVAVLDPGLATVVSATVMGVPATLAAVFTRSVPEIRRQINTIDQRLSAVEAAVKAPVAVVEHVATVAPIVDIKETE